MQQQQALAILSNHKQEIMKLGIKTLAVCGSVARNEAKPDSDVDLLVEFAQDKSIGLSKFMGIKQYLEQLLGREVDLISPKYLKPKMRDRVFYDAISVFPEKNWQLEIEDLENMTPRSWKDRIEDISEAIAKIERYTEAMSYSEFEADERTVDAVLRQITIIGEAARYTPEEVEAQYPEINWEEMRGMRNIVVHEYPDIRLDIVWDVIENDLPVLQEQLHQLLADK